eukprot:m.97566 g.97566  ORF g.97566 m.97566 type:complete len:344 (-) comp16710_c0_seq3:400-1431(-)
MDYGKIKGLEKRISRIVFGTLFLHNAEDPKALLDAVWSTGCNAFDCAAVYGNGRCEELLGEWLRSCGHPRDEIVVITKGGCHGQEKLWSANISPSEIRRDLTNSLRSINVAYVDVFMLHRDDPSVPVKDVVDMMHDFHEEGLFRVWGVSNWEQPRLQAAIEYSTSCNKTAPVCDSLQMSLAYPSRPVWPDTQYMRQDARAWYQTSGVAVLAWECLAKGFMTGKWAREDGARARALHENPETIAHLHPTGDTAAEWRELQLVTAYCTEENFERRDRLQIAAKAEGATMSQIALKYVASQPFESFVLVGTSKVAHFVENAGGGSNMFSPEQVQWLESGIGTSPWE